MNYLLKLFVIALLLSSTMIFNGCKEDETTITITLEDVDACIPAGRKDFSDYTTISRSDIEALFTQNGVAFNVDDIKEVKLNTAMVELTSPSGEDFDEIVVFDIFFRDAGSSSDGTKIAYLTNIASNTATVTLESTFSELTAFLKKESFEAVLHINRDLPTTLEKCVTGTVSLDVTVGGD